MADNWSITDQYGRPIRREILTQEISGPSTTGVRSPIAGYPGDGLNPVRLAQILRSADMGHPLHYLELAELIEERDPHYTGVLGTRKRSVAQLPIFVDAASVSAEHVLHADTIRDWLLRDELQDELFDILDAVGKGFSETEIIWDTSEGQWQPARLEWRDPRWFTFDQRDLKTPLLRSESGDLPLEPFKYISARIRAKSGVPVRSGIGRLAAWCYMFKKFTERDWAIFTQTYGQPLRVGKYPAGASEADKATLFKAVANIAGDCAAIVPESMLIDFVETVNLSAGAELYEKRVEWLDKQVSKAVLGQTSTTDAEIGGLGSGKEHRKVQEDIERADARAISAILNRDLIQPWIKLEFGPQAKYPRLRIGLEDDEDIKQLTDSVTRLVPFGLKVSKSWMNDKLGIPDPDANEEILTAPAMSSPFNFPALNAAQTPAQPTREMPRSIDDLVAQAEQLAAPGVGALLGEVRGIVEKASSLEEIQAELRRRKPGIAEQNLAGLMQMVRVVANLTGRADIIDA